MYNKYQFVMYFEDLSEDEQEEKITEYIEKGIALGNYDETTVVTDEDTRDDARRAITAHFPIYF